MINTSKKIPNEQKSSFKIKKDIAFYLRGVNAKIVTIKKGDELQSLAIVNYDSNVLNKLKLNLSHFSTISHNFETNLNNIIAFINSEILYSELIVDIYYEKTGEQGNFVLNKKIRDSFKDKLKFKWLKLENACGERSLKLGLKRELDESVNQALQQFSINYNLSYELKEKHIVAEEKPTHKLEEEKYLNLFTLIVSFSHLISENQFHIEHEMINNLNHQLIKRHYSYFIKPFLQNKESVLENLRKYMNDINFDNYHYGVEICSTLLNINTIFQNVVSSPLKLNDNQYSFNRIYVEKTEMFYNDEFNVKFYMIPFADERHNLFIGELSEEFIKSSKNNIVNDFCILKKNKLMKKEINNLVIWIPSFKTKNQMNYNKLHVLQDLKFNSFVQETEIRQFHEYLDIEIKSSYNKKEDFHLNPTKDDIIIQNNFLYSIGNIDLYNDLKIESIFVSYSKKEEWLKESI